MSHGWPVSDLSNSAESPEYEPVTDDGISMVRCAWETAATASLSADPRGRLKLIVTDGNCSWWASASGAEMCSKRAKVESGTWLLPVTVLGVAEVLVLVEPAAVLATTAVVPVEVFEPVT